MWLWSCDLFFLVFNGKHNDRLHLSHSLLFYFYLNNDIYVISQNSKSESWKMVSGIIIARITDVYYVPTVRTSLSCSPVEAGTIVSPLPNLRSEVQRDKPCVLGHSIIEGRAWIQPCLSSTSLQLHQGEETSSFQIPRHSTAPAHYFGSTGSCHLTYLGKSHTL